MVIELIKLVGPYGRTPDGMQWGPGFTNRATGEGTDLYDRGVILAHRTSELAVLSDPACGSYLWRGGFAYKAVTPEIVADNGLLIGVKELTTVEYAALPEVTPIQRVAFGILAIRTVYAEPSFQPWADKWLSGEDRSAEAAENAWRETQSEGKWWALGKGTELAFGVGASAWSLTGAAQILQKGPGVEDRIARSAAFAAMSAANFDPAIDFAVLANQAMKF